MAVKLAVVGSLNADLVAKSPRIPKPGETILGTSFEINPGGKGANQAVAAARLGAEVTMVGKTGDDTFSSMLLDNLQREGIETAYVSKDPATPTGTALIVVDKRGQNSIVVIPGSNATLSNGDLDAVEAVIASADVLLLQLEIPVSTVHRAAQIAQSHGVPVILNPAPAVDLDLSLLSLVSFLIPNQTELALLSSLPCEDEEEIAAAGMKIKQAIRRPVIVTMGEKGAMLVEETTYEVFPPYQIRPVDTTAAGDAFVAAFAVALAEGKRIEDAIQWSNAAGALAATRHGAQPSLPTRQEVESMLSLNP